MSKNLFEAFDSVSLKQWKQKIQFDLKGADYNDTLIWKTNEHIDVKPIYHADDFDELPDISDTKATQWQILQSIFVADIDKSNLKAIDIVERGAESIKFILPNETISIENLVQGLNLEEVTLFFELQFLSENYIKNIQVLVPKAKIHLDIIGQLVLTGNWFKSLNEDFKAFYAIVKNNASFSVNVSLYQNAGANMTQQLAYALAHANEYLNSLESSECDLKAINIKFNVSIGTNYFFEIAKIRALRILWKTVASAYGANTSCEIIATPSKRNKTLYDYNTNLLRTTTECMSAILGGANFIENLPYDVVYHKSNAFSERLARNQLLILKHESYFNIVNNPSDGSYYIETLTDQLAEKALELFKDIEKNGGFLSQLKSGTIQRKIKESAQNEQVQFDKSEIKLLGTNIHPNPADNMKHELELYPFVKTNTRKTLIEPIIEKRLSEQLEQNRLKNEN
jgi:methylmalonyl-CoA mutase